MTLLAPWSLFLLIPWITAALWVLLATREPAYVPFVWLWPRNEPHAAARRAPRWPPLWIIGLLAAGLFGIFAAAAPQVSRPGRQFNVVIDCALALSPAGRVQSALAPLHLAAADRLHIIPTTGAPFDTAGPAFARELHFSAASDQSTLDRTLRDALANLSGPLIVISDRPPLLQDARLHWSAAAQPLRDAGIERFAVTDPARGPMQAMVRVFNGTERSAAEIIIGVEPHHIAMPPRGEIRNYFFDVTAAAIAGGSITAQLRLQDDIAADNFAFLAGRIAPPRLAASPDLPPSLRRLLAIYTQQNPPENDSTPIRLSYAPPTLDQTAVWLAAHTATARNGPAVHVVAGPLTRDVDWSRISRRLPAQAAPGPGWSVQVSAGDMALLAAREAPVRQVWIGFDINALSQEQAYVVIWSNVLNWLNGEAQHFTSEPAGSRLVGRAIRLADPAVEASPGIYRDASNRLVAINCEVPKTSAPPAGGLAPLSPGASARGAARPLASWLAMGAMASLAVALELRRRLT